MLFQPSTKDITIYLLTYFNDYLTTKMSNYHYIATVGFECSNAFKLINRAMNINLNTNYDEYECEDYQISLDNDMAFVYFKEPNKALIRRTMDTIAYALGEDQYCWDLRNQKNDREVPEEGEDDDELDGEISVIPRDDCSSCCSANDCTEEEALEILAEYAEEEQLESEKQKKYDDLYKEKYDKMIAAGYFTYHSEFIATCHKFIAIIEDTPRAHMKIIHIRSLYVYIEKNVHILASALLTDSKKQSIIKMMNAMSNQIPVLKEQAIEHMANGVISPVTMGNLFAVFIGAQEKIKETINILLNVTEVKE